MTVQPGCPQRQLTLFSYHEPQPSCPQLPPVDNCPRSKAETRPPSRAQKTVVPATCCERSADSSSGWSRTLGALAWSRTAEPQFPAVRGDATCACRFGGGFGTISTRHGGGQGQQPKACLTRVSMWMCGRVAGSTRCQGEVVPGLPSR